MTKQCGVSRHAMWFHVQVLIQAYHCIPSFVSSLHLLTFAVKRKTALQQMQKTSASATQYFLFSSHPTEIVKLFLRFSFETVNSCA